MGPTTAPAIHVLLPELVDTDAAGVGVLCVLLVTLVTIPLVAVVLVVSVDVLGSASRVRLVGEEAAEWFVQHRKVSTRSHTVVILTTPSHTLTGTCGGCHFTIDCESAPGRATTNIAC